MTATALLTFEEYLAYDDGTDNHYELVDGRLERMNPPTIAHLLIARFLEQTLQQEIQRLSLPWVALREAGVRTGPRKSRLMDVCVVTQQQARELQNESAIFQTPPLLAIEIVSPESVKRDYRYKRSEYAALEIPEYWIVDPLAIQISLLVLEEGLYEERVLDETQLITSPTFPEIDLTVAQILAASQL
ncbi:MAG TPA: Uma2 family endonuclease [Candidatus Obscuribacterales bacterium]